ncbi:ABC transporter substrate-binding protein [Xylophilus sp.]|uniref:ABC transporter substrate-binding protein n=1 Tax=Xylophilus sp. TaxID=2653893 RepID=UPI002D7EE90C|nr:ABC transporter substrate-binding protein [Xylophilus sp.]
MRPAIAGRSGAARSPGRWGRLLGAALALGVLVALGGCSRSDSAQLDAKRRIGAIRADGVFEGGRLRYAETDFHAQGQGRPGGVLRVAVSSDTHTFDIHASSSGNMQWLGRILYDCLVAQDEKGDISPWLATSWDISPDGLTYTFHLRQGVTFSDGTPFDAEAVRVNLDHMRDPRIKSPLAAFYIAPYDHGEVVSAYVFRAHLRQPYAPFLDVLAQSWLGMISPKQIRETPKSIIDKPIGTGPFVLKEYLRDQYAKFERRADYDWSPPVLRHQGPAYIDRLELYFVPEALIRYSALLAGQYDVTLDVPPQNAEAVRANPDFELHSRIRKGNPTRVLTFNTQRPPFDDPRIRLALAKAVDREGIAWIQGFGEFRVKSDYLAANTRHYDPRWRDALQYDPAAANRLLDEAGWTARDAEGFRVKDGKRLHAEVLQSGGSGASTSAAVALQSDARKIGFELTLRLLPQQQLTSPRMTGDYQVLGGSGYWHTNTPDGLTMLYHSQAIPSEKVIAQNASRLQDPALDDLLTRARGTTDPDKQKALYSQAQQRLTELVPSVPTYESHAISAWRKKVKGILFDTSHNVPVFVNAWFDEGQP